MCGISGMSGRRECGLRKEEGKEVRRSRGQTRGSVCPGSMRMEDGRRDDEFEEGLQDGG